MDYSLFYTLGIACVAEGILSAFYHACPSGITIQLDVTMMVRPRDKSRWCVRL